MSTSNDHQKTVRHWKSLEEWQNDPEVQKLAENEFMSSPLSEEDSPNARRTFLKLMGASLAMSTTACLRRPTQKIIPYVNRPKEIIPGVANYYTSVLKDQGEGFGIVVTTREGRPIKIEGNPGFPTNGQGLTARAHAHVLSLYDPDRLREPKKNLLNEERTNRDTVGTNWDVVDQTVKAQLADGGVRVLTSTLASPSTDKLIAEFVRQFGGEQVVWDVAGADSILEANEKTYGKAVLPHYRFDKANLILSLGADFLGTWIAPAEFTKQFSSRRQPDSSMNKLVVFEAMMSLTGQNADQRTPVRASEYTKIALKIAQRLIKSHGASVSGASVSSIDDMLSNAGELSVSNEEIYDLADELWKNRGNSLVVGDTMAGGTDLQVAVNLLNSLLGNDGKTIHHQKPMQTLQGRYKDLIELIEDMEAGKVNTLVMYKTNPIYAFANPARFRKALNKVKLVVYAADGPANETALASGLMVPAHHDMENWSDAEFVKGVFGIQQPTIRPMHNSRSFQDMLLTWKAANGDSPAKWYDYLRSNWQRSVLSGNFDAAWDEALQTGVVGKLDNGSDSARGFSGGAVAEIKLEKAPEFEFVLYQKAGLGDGALANNSWMQEFPDPVTKVVWDNYINVAPSTASKMSLKEGDVVKFVAATKDAQMIELPVHIQPGVNKDTFAVAIGYGRDNAGKVGSKIGVNATRAYNWKDGQLAFSGTARAFEKTSKHIKIANVQGHHTMFGRHLAFETTYDEYKKSKKAGHVKPHFEGEMWPAHKYKGHKWGMSIDVNACTGCSSCIIACQAENNIPVVGKKYVLKGREMHWLRIDRYYSEHPDNPETVHQAMPCQHCDNAPCETVCPVIATTHSDEGLNEMTYNRCVGTRYCSNNCPFKVRRFNWFAYDDFREPQEMVLNPEVQVRSRGVMEKCTFCVQRIKAAKNIARDEERPLKDGDIKVACEQSCPANAIVFGDTNDPESRVSKLIAEKRSYTMLEDINVKPAVRYMTKVRNRPARPDSHQGGH